MKQNHTGQSHKNAKNIFETTKKDKVYLILKILQTSIDCDKMPGFPVITARDTCLRQGRKHCNITIAIIKKSVSFILEYNVQFLSLV